MALRARYVRCQAALMPLSWQIRNKCPQKEQNSSVLAAYASHAWLWLTCHCRYTWTQALGGGACVFWRAMVLASSGSEFDEMQAEIWALVASIWKANAAIWLAGACLLRIECSCNDCGVGADAEHAGRRWR